MKKILLLEFFKKSKYKNILDRKEKTVYLRSKVISELIQLVFANFIDNQPATITGKYDKSLMDEIVSVTTEKLNITEKLSIYNSRPAIMIEISGSNVVVASYLIYLSMLSTVFTRT
ncbi:MAG: hypothetical protein JW917_01285 [Ignavibacteria bacterium]|nr:hypothetical protein [Ignavibacteria bacterium]